MKELSEAIFLSLLFALFRPHVDLFPQKLEIVRRKEEVEVKYREGCNQHVTFSLETRAYHFQLRMCHTFICVCIEMGA
jgi:hypothetical protein